MNRIERPLQKLAKKRAVFVGYLCAGDPDFDSSVEACRAVIESGVDVLEIGVSFSDPWLMVCQSARRPTRTRKRHHQQNLLKLVRAIRDFSKCL